MTTKQYYQKILSIYTAELIAYFVVGLICFMLTWLIGLRFYLTLLVTSPFIVLVLFSLNRNLQLKWKLSTLTESKEISEGSPLTGNSYFLGFLPAPTLHAVIFSPKGNLVGALKDKRENSWMWMIPASILIFLPRKYILLDHNGTILCEYRSQFGLNGRIDIFNANQEKIGTYKQSKQLGKKGTSHVVNPFGVRQYEGGIMHGSEFFMYQSYDNREVVHYSCGWMPSYYKDYFPDPNTPFLSFTEGATEDEKRLGYCFCLDYLQQQNH